MIEVRLVDTIVAILLAEIAVIRRAPPDLLAGLFLVLALRSALIGGRRPVRLALLAAAGLAHANNWRGTRNGSIS